MDPICSRIYPSTPDIPHILWSLVYTSPLLVSARHIRVSQYRANPLYFDHVFQRDGRRCKEFVKPASTGTALATVRAVGTAPACMSAPTSTCRKAMPMPTTPASAGLPSLRIEDSPPVVAFAQSSGRRRWTDE